MIELRGMTWDHPRGYDPMVATAAAYQTIRPDVRIAWEARSLQAFADRPLAQLAAEYDLIVIDHPHVGEIARERCLLPLDAAGRDAELAAFAGRTAGGSHESYQYDGRQWALAIDAATQVAAYRRDLLPTPPIHWSEVEELARAGRVLWPLKPVDLLMSFFTLAANRNTPCAASASELIAQDDGLAVLETIERVARHLPLECREMNPPMALDRLAGDARYAYCPLLYGYSNYSRAGFRPRLVHFADAPLESGDGPSGSCLGGTGLAISSNCRNLEVAVDYCFRVASPPWQAGVYFDAGGQPAHLAAWEDERINQASNGFFRATRRTLDQSWVRPRCGGYLTFQDEGGQILHDWLWSQAPMEATLKRLDDAYSRSRDLREGRSQGNGGDTVPRLCHPEVLRGVRPDS